MDTRSKTTGTVPKISSDKVTKDRKSQKIATKVTKQLVLATTGTAVLTDSPSTRSFLEDMEVGESGQTNAPKQASNIDKGEGQDDTIDAFVDANEMQHLEINENDGMNEDIESPNERNSSEPIGAANATNGMSRPPMVRSVDCLQMPAEQFIPTEEISGHVNTASANAPISVRDDNSSATSGNRPGRNVRQMYVNRLLDYQQRVRAGPFNKIALQTMLDGVDHCCSRIIKLVEDVEDNQVLDEKSLRENQEAWELAIELKDKLTIEIRTQLDYLDPQSANAGTPLHHRNESRFAMDTLKRMDAKII